MPPFNAIHNIITSVTLSNGERFTQEDLFWSKYGFTVQKTKDISTEPGFHGMSDHEGTLCYLNHNNVTYYLNGTEGGKSFEEAPDYPTFTVTFAHLTGIYWPIDG